MQCNYIKTNLQVLKYLIFKSKYEANTWYSIFCKLHCHVRSEVLMEINIKITVLWCQVYGTIKMEGVDSSKMLIDIHQTIWHHTPKITLTIK